MASRQRIIGWSLEEFRQQIIDWTIDLKWVGYSKLISVLNILSSWYEKGKVYYTDPITAGQEQAIQRFFAVNPEEGYPELIKLPREEFKKRFPWLTHSYDHIQRSKDYNAKNKHQSKNGEWQT